MRNDILELLRAVPFRPFRMVMNNGDHYDVVHPEFVDVGRSSVHYNFPDASLPDWQRIRILSLILVNHVEYLPQWEPAPKNGPPKS